MKHYLLKALTKKIKWINTIQNNDSDSDNSNDSLTSEDENSIPDNENLLYKYFNNKYICLKYLGRGTFSRVWMVYDISDHNFYAMKVFFKEYIEDSMNECKIYKLLNNNNTPNSNIIKLYDSFIFNKQKCLILELMGHTLLDFINYYYTGDESDENEKGDESDESDINMPINIVKGLTKQIFTSIQELHDKNIIHTDLKFENIMFSNTEHLVSIFNNLNIKEKYISLINTNLPTNFTQLEKTKKKNIKRKIKNKCVRLLCNYIKENKDYETETEKNIDYKQLFFDKIISSNTIGNIGNNYRIKIVDLGNCEVKDDKYQDEIMIRNYRPPENILNDYYDEKADIWSIGCLIFELLTGEYLFDIDNNNNNRNREHLHQIFEYIGKIPLELSLNCDFKDELFDKKGGILNMNPCNYTSIDKILVEKYNYDVEIAKDVTIFLKNIFEYNLKKRYSAIDALDDIWLSNIS